MLSQKMRMLFHIWHRSRLEAHVAVPEGKIHPLGTDGVQCSS